LEKAKAWREDAGWLILKGKGGKKARKTRSRSQVRPAALFMPELTNLVPHGKKNYQI